MAAMRLKSGIAAALLIGALAAWADVRQCDCVLTDPEKMKARECSLCREAEKHPATPEFFEVKDINPKKPNRWLILPREHDDGAHNMHELPKKTRDRLWAFTIAQAKQHFPNGDWGLAYNGDKVRTQCHLHIHIGKWVTVAENRKVKLVRRLEDFPAPVEGGILIHPVKGGFHVHTGEDIMETALVR